MKKATRAQIFIAQNWPQRILLTTGTVLAVFLAIRACEPSLALFTDWQSASLFALVILLAATVGFLSAGILSIFLVPMYCSREKLNGGPFSVGDTVQVLSGPGKGQITKVYSTWQGNSLRVTLGPDAENKFTDIVVPTQLLREEEAEQSL